MPKFKLGDSVTYAGANSCLKTHFSNNSLTVDGIIHDGEYIGNGEKNISGENMYACLHNDSQVRFLFRESELSESSPVTNSEYNSVHEKWQSTCQLYREIALQEIKKLLREITGAKPGANCGLDVEEAYQEDYILRQGAYYTPNSYSAFYIFQIFKLEKDRLVIFSYEDECSSCTLDFTENDLSCADLEAIHDILTELKKFIDAGYLYLKSDVYDIVKVNYTDENDNVLDIGTKVTWDDEAGKNEKGEPIVFTIVEKNDEGYFNLSHGKEDKNPSRWAYYKELTKVDEI